MSSPVSAIAIVVALAISAAAQAAELPDMVRIPAGSFWSGSLPAETAAAGTDPAYAAREQPRIRMRIAHAFDIGRTEVTVGQFATFVRATGWKTGPGCATLIDGPSNAWAARADLDWAHPGFPQTDDQPVVCVALADAQAYADWLGRTTGDHYRLPTSAEWEYAARAGTQGIGWWRNAADVCRYANISDLSRAKAQNGGDADPTRFAPCDDGHVFTAPVASYRPNRFGLYDMIGNVWEWTLDCLDATQARAPTDGSARTTGDCRSHVDRGASWTNSPRFVRLAARHGDTIDNRDTVLGFRVVRDRR